MKSYVSLYSPRHTYFHAEIDDALIQRVLNARENGKQLVPQNLIKNLAINTKNPKKQNLDFRGDIIQRSMVIEKPDNLVLVSHVGWNDKLRTFDFSNLSKEYKQVFKNAGLKKNELKDADTALAIYETLFTHSLINKADPIKKKKQQASAAGGPAGHQKPSAASNKAEPEIKERDQSEEKVNILFPFFFEIIFVLFDKLIIQARFADCDVMIDFESFFKKIN